jgi:DNA-binding response OmpR family regulator
VSAERSVESSQSPPVVVCITETPEERARLAAMFDGVGVLVLADNAASASHFLGTLGDRTAREPIRLGRLTVDLTQFSASWANRPLSLTAHELVVLGSLAHHPGRVWTYRQLHDEAWERTYFTGPAAVQSVVKRLRRKLRSAGASLEIEAVRGLGFRIAPE